MHIRNNGVSYGHCKLEDREYDQKEFFRCATKFRHINYWTALDHVRSLREALPLANVAIYECRWCDGLHVTTGRSWKNWTKLTHSLKHLEKITSSPGYQEKAPKEIRTRDAKLLLDLRARIVELEAEYKIRKG
jgi:hypothetical protein